MQKGRLRGLPFFDDALTKQSISLVFGSSDRSMIALTRIHGGSAEDSEPTFQASTAHLEPVLASDEPSMTIRLLSPPEVIEVTTLLLSLELVSTSVVRALRSPCSTWPVADTTVLLLSPFNIDSSFVL